MSAYGYKQTLGSVGIAREKLAEQMMTGVAYRRLTRRLCIQFVDG